MTHGTELINFQKLHFTTTWPHFMPNTLNVWLIDRTFCHSFCFSLSNKTCLISITFSDPRFLSDLSSNCHLRWKTHLSSVFRYYRDRWQVDFMIWPGVFGFVSRVWTLYFIYYSNMYSCHFRKYLCRKWNALCWFNQESCLYLKWNETKLGFSREITLGEDLYWHRSGQIQLIWLIFRETLAN